MIKYLIAIYENTDKRGKEIIEKLAPKLLGDIPRTREGFTKYLEDNLKLTKQLEPRITNPILRKSLDKLNKDTEQLLKKLRSGDANLTDIIEYVLKNRIDIQRALKKIGADNVTG